MGILNHKRNLKCLYLYATRVEIYSAAAAATTIETLSHRIHRRLGTPKERSLVGKKYQFFSKFIRCKSFKVSN